MASPSLPLLFLFSALILSHTTFSLPTSQPSHGSGCDKSAASFIPTDGFLSTLRSTLDEIQRVVSIVSSFSGVLGGGLRMSSAVSDCLDLLDLSSDELSWSLSSSQATTTSFSGTGNRRSDLKSWLSAALSNQDTCKEGLDATDSMLGSLIATGLETVTSLVADSLSEVAVATGSNGGKGGRRLVEGFPTWIKSKERKLLQAAPQGIVADAVVAQDGTGNYKTIKEAVDAVPDMIEKRYVIHIKKGVYKENVEVKKKKWNVMLVGDGMGVTVISGNRNFIDGWTTYRSATLAVVGKGFIARDLTVENTAGPSKHQAVALRSDSDLSVFYLCSFEGYQDTLYAHALRQFYRDCKISGTVDFIFGDAAAVFQNCQLLARKPLPDQKNSVTAQGRKDPNQNTGFCFQFCNVSADVDLASALATSSPNQTYTYLGRPWKEYSRTVIMQSYIGNVVRPEGWLEWNGNFGLDTLFYGEFMNFGPGSGLASRVKWPGYHAMNNTGQVANFTVAQFIDGNLWLPSTGVKYTAGLTM
ncbi:hypothetical protein LUZ63_000253 [Rhynchospora breviuscula]|uniref:Pectinesterase n=1 Tax=Rhynchospora breviuscula TaxID=2022672 RepID=A0A9Q0CVZ4_9POAL|nr:hypothetical protein LUZ63_000253 [Rhynchospora breviuscula]